MFKSKNNSTDRNTMATNSTNGSAAHPTVNMISEESRMKGSLNTKNDVRVSGVLEGQIEAGGKCIVTQTGKVEGDVNAKEADIAGTVDGEITITNKLILRKTARVTGDINTKTILIEEGASFDGACKMSSKPESGNKAGTKKDLKTAEEVSPKG